MADKRMFSLNVIDSDNFTTMPMGAQLLYFHLAMRADDDGFVNKPKQIMSFIGAREDDLKALITKQYIIPFEFGIIVIKHWRLHNYIKNDRYKATTYQNELKQLSAKGGVYELDTGCIHSVSEMDTQIRLDKNSIDKNSIIGSEQSPFALLLNDGSYYNLPIELLNTLKSTYPKVDVEGELKKMIAWLECNESKRKTARGIKRFINSWLNSASDSDTPIAETPKVSYDDWAR